jgi:predicted nucleotidyltransferase
MAILSHLLPEPLRADLTPVLHRLEEQLQPRGLWLFGSWARGQQSRRSDIDLLILGLDDERLLDAYDRALRAIEPSPLPVQPLVAGESLLKRHGDSPFWRGIRADSIPLLEGSRFPLTIR